jgi:ATP-dependent DNA helicase PIF1
MELLNTKQRYAVDNILEGKNVLLTGPAGTGKSYTIKYIVDVLEKKGLKVALTAPTGTAAIIIGGQTIHSYMGLGLGTGSVEEIMIKVIFNKTIYNNIADLDILIIDEISMVDDELLEKMSAIFSLVKYKKYGDIKLLDKPFGSIQVIFIGDFCQLAPVKGQYCFQSKIWERLEIKVVVLEELIRQSDDLLFQKILQIVRKGKCTDNIMTVLNTLRDTVFDNDIIPTKLYPINVDVDKINKIEINKLKKEGNKSVTYKAMSSDDNKKIASKFDIELTENSQVIIIRNVDFNEFLVNGTRGVIKHLDDNYVIISDIEGKTHTINYYRDVYNNKFSSHVTHMPIRTCYALSIHKSQGMTIDALELDLGPNIFACGQSYTALSRAKSLRSIKILDVSKDSFRTHAKVKNFYKEMSV